MGLRRAASLFMFGVIHGAVSGSTLDIVTFSLHLLTLRSYEKVATPRPVVLMAGNTVAGFARRLFFSPKATASETWH